MSVPRFSVRQTVMVNVLFFVCLLGGWATLARIPVEFFPNINLNEVVISTVWSGASAEEVERLVTQPLEDELRGIADIDEMRSTSQANRSTAMGAWSRTLSRARNWSESLVIGARRRLARDSIVSHAT